ncbi:MAG: chorismate mutase [Caldisphaera sp.]|jgi:chorismate mutase|uniref:chorismate mutase n=1 Tax=Caldisphaera sp. TaxID=2060322 RepID=UPI000CBF4B01|nr:MAG: chorismate mutase [Caldisphaera sp.]PMP91182.1 MAG: chorismate mutase [Caldisphaera sp.]
METDTEELNILRNKIDEIDKQIINLLDERVSICKEIGKIKKIKKIKITDKSREKEILLRAGNFKSIYIEIIDICKKAQGDYNEI